MNRRVRSSFLEFSIPSVYCIRFLKGEWKSTYKEEKLRNGGKKYMAMKLLSARNLYKEYKTQNGEKLCVAVNQISLDIEKDDFITIMGASGSGKSSLLYLLSGMTEMTSGEITYLGKNLSKMSDKQKAEYRGKEIGLVFQEGNLLEDLTVLKNVALPSYLYEKKKTVDKRAQKWLEILGLLEKQNKYPNELSGGQKQRVAIARAFMNKPKILFLDEPTGSLDVTNGGHILDLLVNLNKMGQSMVMVTHDIGAAARGSKVILIKDGAICETIFLGKYEKEKLEERKATIYQAWGK